VRKAYCSKETRRHRPGPVAFDAHAGPRSCRPIPAVPHFFLPFLSSRPHSAGLPALHFSSPACTPKTRLLRCVRLAVLYRSLGHGHSSLTAVRPRGHRASVGADGSVRHCYPASPWRWRRPSSSERLGQPIACRQLASRFSTLDHLPSFATPRRDFYPRRPSFARCTRIGAGCRG
jgi:hypothetical protein